MDAVTERGGPRIRALACWTLIAGLGVAGGFAFAKAGIGGRLGLSGAALFAVVANLRSSRLARSKRHTVFDSRRDLSLNEVFSTFYASSGLPETQVTGLWEAAARALRLPPGRLRPTDRFDQELAVTDFFASLDDPRDDLAEFAQRFADQYGSSVEFGSIKTLDDLIIRLAAIAGAD